MRAGVRLRVRLTPRGGRDAVDGVRDGILLARVSAPPVEGAANEALVRLLARELDVPRQAIRIVTGTGARLKTIEIEAEGAAETARRRWAGIAVADR